MFEINSMTLTITGRIGVTTLQITNERSVKKMDEKIYRKLLDEIAKVHPNDFSYMDRIEEFGGRESIYAALSYLSSKGLVDAYVSKGIDDHISLEGSARLTSDGVTFMRKDDGIGDELNAVVIKIHEDTIKQMIELKILASDLPAEEKQTNLKQLRLLPSVGIQRLVTLLLEKGMENTPALLQMLHSALG